MVNGRSAQKRSGWLAVRRAALLGVAALLLTIAGVSPAGAACKGDEVAHGSKACFTRAMWDAVQSAGGGDDQMTLLLMHNAWQESRGGRTGCKIGKDPNFESSYNWGPTQVNNNTIWVCGGSNYAIKVAPKTTISIPSGKNEVPLQTVFAIWKENTYACQNDAAFVANAAMTCSRDYYERQVSSKCQTFASKLCSYAVGRGFCTGYTRKDGTKVAAQPSGDCGYSRAVCGDLGTVDCNKAVAVLGKHPVTGEDNAGEFSAEEEAAAGNDALKLPADCANIPLLQKLRLGFKGFQTAAMLVAGHVYGQHKTDSYASCTISMIGYFEKIGMLLDTSVSWMGKIMLGLLTTLMNFACKYVVNAINSALSSVMCLSLPTIGFSVSMPGMPSSSCDGVSLLDLVQAQGSFKTNIPYSSSTLGMSLGLEELVKRR